MKASTFASGVTTPVAPSTLLTTRPSWTTKSPAAVRATPCGCRTPANGSTLPEATSTRTRPTPSAIDAIQSVEPAGSTTRSTGIGTVATTTAAPPRGMRRIRPLGRSAAKSVPSCACASPASSLAPATFRWTRTCPVEGRRDRTRERSGKRIVPSRATTRSYGSSNRGPGAAPALADVTASSASNTRIRLIRTSYTAGRGSVPGSGSSPGAALSSKRGPVRGLRAPRARRGRAEERPHRHRDRQHVRLPDALRPRRRLPARDDEEGALPVGRVRAPLVPARRLERALAAGARRHDLGRVGRRGRRARPRLRRAVAQLADAGRRPRRPDRRGRPPAPRGSRLASDHRERLERRRPAADGARAVPRLLPVPRRRGEPPLAVSSTSAARTSSSASRSTSRATRS